MFTEIILFVSGSVVGYFVREYYVSYELDYLRTEFAKEWTNNHLTVSDYNDNYISKENSLEFKDWICKDFYKR